jgi:Tfp pilus assembly protein PilX
MIPHYKKEKRGFALLLAIIISSVMLAIGVSILKISVNQITLSTTARESEFAFQAAHAGIDCMSYWRNKKASEYLSTTTTSSPSNPSVSCFGAPPNVKSTQQLSNSSSNGVINVYKNTFSWGGGTSGILPRCTETELYVMTGKDGSVSMSFPERDYLGTNGRKTCADGRVCNIIISRGYNRACITLSTSIYTVQRELTQEF